MFGTTKKIVLSSGSCAVSLLLCTTSLGNVTCGVHAEQLLLGTNLNIGDVDGARRKSSAEQTANKVEKDESAPVFPRSPGIVGLYDQAIALWPENAPTYEKAKRLFKTDPGAWETTGEKEKFLDLVGKLEKHKPGCSTTTTSVDRGADAVTEITRRDGVSHWYYLEDVKRENIRESRAWTFDRQVWEEMLSGIVKGKPRFQPGTVIVGGLSAYNRGVYPFPDLVPDVKQEDFVEDRDAWHWYYDPRKGGREWTWNHDAWEKMLSKVVKHVNKVVKEEEHRVNNKFVKENNKLQTQQTSPLTKVKKDESTPVFPRSPGIVGLYDQAIALWPENAPTYEKAKTLFKNDKSAWETTGEKEKFLDLVGKLEEQKTSTAGAPAPTSGEQALVQQVVSSCSGTPGMKKFCRCPEAEKRYGDGVSHWYFNEQEGEWEWTWNQEEWSRMLEGIEKGKPFFKPGAVIVGGLSAASKIPFVSPVPDLVVEDRDAWHWYYDAQKGEWEWTWNHEAWEKFLSKVLKEKALKSFANRMQSGLALPREEPLVLKKKSQNKVR